MIAIVEDTNRYIPLDDAEDGTTQVLRNDTFVETIVPEKEYVAEVLPVSLELHPNADTLSIIKFYDYTYVAKTSDWIGVTKAVYIQPDELVPTDKVEFSWLAKDAKYTQQGELGGPYARVRAIKLRNIQSFGIAIPAPEFANIGDNLYDYYQLGHYDPDVCRSPNQRNYFGLSNGECCKGPNLLVPFYDIENFRKYSGQMFTEGEPVEVSEKAHGQNSSFVFHDGEFYVRSRKEWKKEFSTAPKVTLEELIEKIKDVNKATAIYEKNVLGFKSKQSHLWYVLRNTPNLMEWLQTHEGYVVMGEVYGPSIQGHDFRYDSDGPPKLRIFDIYRERKYLDIQKARELAYNLPWVPEIKMEMPYNFDKCVELAVGKSNLNNQCLLEGVVIRPVSERIHPKLGRCILKVINPKYLEKS